MTSEELKKALSQAEDISLRKQYGVDRKRLTRLDGLKNNEGCLMLYVDEDESYWKKQLYYTLDKEGRIIPINREFKRNPKRQYKKRTVMPQLY